jgi:hypothetical protein
VAAGDAHAAARVKDALELLVRVTKQEGEASVVLATSEHALPFRLQSLGFKTSHFTDFIVTEEVPPGEMRALLTGTWGCGAALADGLMSLYGGHVLHAANALTNLARLRAGFRGVAALSSLGDAVSKCVAEESLAGVGALSTAQQVALRADVVSKLRQLVATGYVPLANGEDKAAEVISRANAGFLIPSSAAAAGVPPEWLLPSPGQLGGEAPDYLLVPASGTMRLLLAKRYGGGASASA